MLIQGYSKISIQRAGILTNDVIDRRWELSAKFHTVKSHVIRLFNKLTVSDRTRVSVRAVRNGID